jgi:hypothetical protein
MTDRERTTVLAALRYFQQNRAPALVAHHERFAQERPLSDAEIDQLCQRLSAQRPDGTLRPTGDRALPRIIVCVEGGVVHSVHADRPMDVDVLDHDNWHQVDPATAAATWRYFADLADAVEEGSGLVLVY